MPTGPARHCRAPDRPSPPVGSEPPATAAAPIATTRNGVALTDAQRKRLVDLACGDSRRAERARMLLLAERGHNDREVARAIGVHRVTVWRLRKRVAERGIEAALARPYRKKLDEDQREYLHALARSAPPNGRARWTMKLLTATLVERGIVESISHVAVWQALKDGTPHRD